MLHRPWTFTDQLVARMADSSIQDKAHSLQREPRSEGLHCSTLLHKLHPHANPLPEEKLRIFGLLGLAFEDRAELALLTLTEDADWPWEAVRPGEVHADGIACSPDILLVPKSGEGAVRELSLKCTWKSCRGLPTAEEGENEFPKSFDYYLDQSMAYSTPLNTDGGVLVVYFVSGDYKPPLPQVHGWELEWSLQEKEETWDSLLTIARGL
jgi:hypothetical protein